MNTRRAAPRPLFWLGWLCLLTPLWMVAAIWALRTLRGPRPSQWPSYWSVALETLHSITCVLAVGAILTSLRPLCRPAQPGERGVALGATLGAAAILTCGVPNYYAKPNVYLPLLTCYVLAQVLPWQRRRRLPVIVEIDTEPPHPGRGLQTLFLLTPIVSSAVEVGFASWFTTRDFSRGYSFYCAVLLSVQCALSWLVLPAAGWLRLSPCLVVLLTRHAQGWIVATLVGGYLGMLWFFATSYGMLTATRGQPAPIDSSRMAMLVLVLITLTAWQLLLPVLADLWQRDAARLRKLQSAS